MRKSKGEEGRGGKNVGEGRIGIHEKDREIYIFWKSEFGLWFPFWNESPNDNIIVISLNLFFLFSPRKIAKSQGINRLNIEKWIPWSPGFFLMICRGKDFLENNKDCVFRNSAKPNYFDSIDVSRIKLILLLP